MKTIILIILLSASACFARPLSLTYDPNDMIVVEADPNYMECTVTIRISVEEYAAIQGLGYSLNDVIDRSNLTRTLHKIIKQWKDYIIKHLDAIELQAIIEKE